MEDMEKKTEEMAETGEVEMTQRMAERAGWIDTQTYWYLMQLLELNVDQAQERLPWDIEILRKVFDSTVSILKEYGHAVCNPYVATPDTGRQYRCTLSECGCESCNCQDEFMEKERLLSNIEDTAARNGFKVMDGDKDCIIVRNSEMDMDFEIRVGQLAG
nr:hypothetical protein [uncultured Acetatifactor sp.]